MLLMMGAQQLKAQDAFYIYRNDGNFDGFFFDQIERMGYSKFDLDSVEHDIYVVQEIETADSLYRIPIAAIDSIGFQQPEIILNPNLKNMDETGLSQYVEDFSPGNIYISKNTPSNLIPQVGDVLVSYDNERFNFWGSEDFSGYGGKVVSVTEMSDSYYINVDKLTDLSDVFVQFITAEEVVQDASGAISRRLAGWNSARHGVQGSSYGNLIDFTLPLKDEFSVGDGGTIGAELDINTKVKMAVVYQISMKSVFIKVMLNEDIVLESKIYGKYEGDCEFNFNGLPKLLRSIKFPVAAPILQTRPIPTAFIRASGEMGAELSLPSVGFHARQTFVIDNDMKPIMSFSGSATGPQGEPDKSVLERMDLSVYFKGSAQIGTKFSANIETNDWIEDLFLAGITLDLYVGPQIDAQLDFRSSLDKIVNGSVDFYDAMKYSNVNLTGLAANLEAKGAVKMLGQEEDEKFAEENFKWFEKEWNLFPEFSGDVSYSHAEEAIVTDVKASKPVFVPSKLGMGVYSIDQGELTLFASEFNESPYFLIEGISDKMKYSFKGLPCGRYYVRPMLQTLGYEIPANPEWHVEVPPMLKIQEDSIHVEGGGNRQEIVFSTNAKNVDVAVYSKDGYPSDMVQATVSDYDDETRTAKLTLDINENASIFGRTSMVVLTASSGVSETSDTLLVGQDALSSEIKYLYGEAKCYGTYKRHQWGNENGEAYDYAQEDPWSLRIWYSNNQKGDIRCVREGNLLTITKKFVEDTNETDEVFTKAVHHETDEWTLLVDVSDKNAVRIVGGSSYVRTEDDSAGERVEKDPFYDYVTKRDRFSGNGNCTETVSFTCDVKGTLYEDTNSVYFECTDLPSRLFSGSMSSESYYTTNVTYYDKDGNVTDTYSSVDNNADSFTPNEEPCSIVLTLSF